MRVSCPQCNELYRIKESLIPQQGVKTHCKVCNALFQIHPLEIVALDTLLDDEPDQSQVAVRQPNISEVTQQPAQAAAEPPAPSVEPEPVVEKKPQPVVDDESDDEEPWVDKVRSWVTEMELEQAMPIAAILFAIIIVFSMLQVERDVIDPVPLPSSMMDYSEEEEMGDSAEGEEVSMEAEAVAEGGDEMPTAMEIQAILANDPVETDSEPSAAVEEEVEVEAEPTTDADQVREEEVSQEVVSEPVADEPEGEAETAISADELYSVDRFKTLMAGFGAEEGATEAEEDPAAEPVVEKEAAPAESSVQSESAEPEEEPVASTASAGGLYSVDRFKALMARFGGEEGAAEEETATEPMIEETTSSESVQEEPVSPESVAETAPVAKVEQAATVTPVQPMNTDAAVTTGDDDLSAISTSFPAYSAERFKRLMEKLGGEEKEE